MPLKKPVPSLKSLCFRKIHSKVDLRRDQLRCLPLSVIDDFYQFYEQLENRSQRLNPDVFLTTYTRELYSVRSFTTASAKIIKKKVLKCKRMTILDLTRSPKVSSQCLTTLFCNLTNIHTLKLCKNLWITNGILTEIVTHCPKLKDLDVSSCENIFDDGVLSLHRSNIEYLDLLFTSVTSKGCLHVLKTISTLKQLHHLELMDHAAASTLFSRIKNEFRSQQFTSALEKTDWMFSDITDIKIASRVFPNLLRLDSRGVNYFTDEIDVSILNIVRNLIYLKLDSYESIDFNLIFTFCPKLQQLLMYNCTISGELTDEDSNFLPHLCQLKLYKIKVSQDFLLKLLLKCNQLEELCVSDNICFNDELVTELIAANGLQKLVTLELNSCKSVTLSLLLRILESEIPLKVIELSCCYNIDSKAQHRIDNFIVKNNLDVQFSRTYLY